MSPLGLPEAKPRSHIFHSHFSQIFSGGEWGLYPTSGSAHPPDPRMSTTGQFISILCAYGDSWWYDNHQAVLVVSDLKVKR